MTVRRKLIDSGCSPITPIARKVGNPKAYIRPKRLPRVRVLYVGIGALSGNTMFLWCPQWFGLLMNSSLYTANRATHLKIVVVGLAAAIMIAVISISARELNLGTDIMTAQNPTVIKAGPVILSDRVGQVVR